MSVQAGRKKRAWLGWIPAGILVIAIIGVGVASAVLVGGGLGAPAPRPTKGQVTDLNWSIFTTDGLDFIASARQVRIDLSSPPIEAGLLGLDDDGTLVLDPIDNIDTTLDYDLIVNGGGEGAGGFRSVVTQITIVTEGGLVTHVTAPLRDVVNFRQTLDVLVGEADVFGWDTSGIDAIYQTAADATRAGTGYEFTFGPADAAGTPVSATARCDTSGYCIVAYDVTPPVR